MLSLSPSRIRRNGLGNILIAILEDSASSSGETEVPIAGDVAIAGIGVEGEELASRGILIGCFNSLEDGCTFVSFVKHGHIHHGCAGADDVVQLFPEEATPQARDFIEGLVGLEIMGGKAWKDDGQIINVERVAFCHIGINVILLKVVGAGGVNHAPDRPWTDDVEATVDTAPSRVGSGISAERPPAGGDTSHHSCLVSRIGSLLEPCDELLGLAGSADAVGEAPPPHCEYGLPSVMKVALAFSDALIINQMHPISLDVLDEGPLVSVANIIHVDKDSSVLLGSAADVIQHLVSNVGPLQSITNESLDKESVNSIILEPTTVSLDGLGGVGTVQSSSGAITVLEIGVGELIGIVLSQIWPHIDRDGVSIGNCPSVGPVLPSVEPTCGTMQ